MQDAYAYCAELVRAADRDRFLASLFAPAEHRGALHALYAFDVEINRVREIAREPLPGEIRLQWWSDVLNGERGGEAAANPVAAALMTTVRRYSLPVDPLLALVEAHRSDLYDDPMATIADLEAYAAKTASSLISHAMRILDDSAHMADIARPAGVALAIVRSLYALPRQAARRQTSLPTDLLTHHGVIIDDVFAGKATRELLAALQDLRNLAAAHLAQAGQLMAAVPSAVLPALLPLAVARVALARIKRPDYDPFAPPEISQWRRQWAIWRAARNPARIAA
jgi:15-cis-phytoene synthase